MSTLAATPSATTARSTTARSTTARSATARSATTSAPLRVPWPTVLPLAIVAAYGNGFWLIAMRETVGAIERTPGPFLVWLRESTLLLPLYVFAVLAALTLALRWFGPGPLRARATATTLLLVGLTCTLAAIAVQATSAIYDYQLQSQHVTNMALHMPTCDTQCITGRKDTALALQLRAVGLNSLVLLVSNLVLLGLAVAFRGGRLAVASARRGAARIGRFDNVELFLITGLLGTAAVHGAAIGEQLARWPAAGLAVLLITVAEVDAALLFLLRLRSMHLLATVAVSALPLLVWLYARTTGLPFGPDAGNPGQIGLTDSVVVLLEVATLLVALRARRSRASQRKPGTAQHTTPLALAGIAAVTTIGVAVALGALGGGPHDVTQSPTSGHVHNPAAVSLSQ